MAEFISKECLYEEIETRRRCRSFNNSPDTDRVLLNLQQLVQLVPSEDVAPIIRCKDCVFYHKEHVVCNDGTEKDPSEFADEDKYPFGFVTVDIGITVGGKCEFDCNSGYREDKSVFRSPEDYCSKAILKKDGKAEK